jgi:chemotaxis response regulator CheB
MPKMDGVEVLEATRKLKPIPVVMISDVVTNTASL